MGVGGWRGVAPRGNGPPYPPQTHWVMPGGGGHPGEEVRASTGLVLQSVQDAAQVMASPLCTGGGGRGGACPAPWVLRQGPKRAGASRGGGGLPNPTR